MTRMRAYRERLDQLKADGDFNKLFEFAVYVAEQQIDSDRIGRRQDKAMRECLTDDEYSEVMRMTMQSMFTKDEFYDEEKAFHEHFDDVIEIDSEDDDNE